MSNVVVEIACHLNKHHVLGVKRTKLTVLHRSYHSLLDRRLLEHLHLQKHVSCCVEGTVKPQRDLAVPQDCNELGSRRSKEI